VVCEGGAAMVCSGWSTLHMQGASRSPLVLFVGFGKAHVLLFQTCRSPPIFSRLAKRFLIDQVVATVFSGNYERCVARVARSGFACVPPGIFVYLVML
jgi:hypothetical protein